MDSLTRNPEHRAAPPAFSGTGGKSRVVIVANTMYSPIVSGGEIHTCKLTEALLSAGYQVHFLCGQALKQELERRKLDVTVTPTDNGMMPPCDFSSLSGQVRLFMDYFRRLRGSLRVLSEIRPDDILYSATELWWDYVPSKRSAAQRRILYLGMDAPTLKEVLLKSRPDVKTIRLPSLHYWMGQKTSLRDFRTFPRKSLIFAHENQAGRLLEMGYSQQELVYVGNGVDLKQPRAVPEQKKVYDVVWVGRVHKQKGIEDLVASLAHLAKRIDGFRAVMVGDLKESLGPRITAAGLQNFVDFTGYVSESEKFRYLKSSRVFLMSSRYESWGIVVGEALAGGLPVVAYDLDCYRPVFGDLLRYVPCFDTNAFMLAAEEEVLKARAGKNNPDQAKLEKFIQENSWEKVAERFLGAVRSLEQTPV